MLGNVQGTDFTSLPLASLQYKCTQNLFTLFTEGKYSGHNNTHDRESTGAQKNSLLYGCLLSQITVHVYIVDVQGWNPNNNK